MNIIDVISLVIIVIILVVPVWTKTSREIKDREEKEKLPYARRVSDIGSTEKGDKLYSAYCPRCNKSSLSSGNSYEYHVVWCEHCGVKYKFHPSSAERTGQSNT